MVWESTPQNDSGFIMMNGAYVWGFDRGDNTNSDSFAVDYNGLDAPNLVGQDIIWLNRCYDEDTNGAACAHSPKLHGRVSSAKFDPDSVTLYEKLF
jgi:hypothetical protein